MRESHILTTDFVDCYCLIHKVNSARCPMEYKQRVTFLDGKNLPIICSLLVLKYREHLITYLCRGI